MMLDNEVRRQVAKSPQETMRDFLDADIDEEENYIYTGLVVDNNDPDRQGKCRVRVYSIFPENIPDDSLPWALPDFSFVGSKVGNFTVPPIGTIVNIYFDKGDIYLPHYTTKVVDKNNLPKQRLVDYPDNVVLYEMDDGDYYTLNRKSKVTTIHHSSGTQVKINKNGSVEIEIVDDKTEHVAGDETHTVDGTHIIQNGSIVPLIKASITITPGGMVTIDANTIRILHQTLGFLEVNGSVVTPTGTGPLNAIPFDPVTGMPHSGNICI